ncbi:MAG: histidine--tRNA ligase [Patescibacteria group bacterium]
MTKVQPKLLKGFRDFLPEKAKKRQWLIDTLKKVFESYGFEPLETPALEYEEVLLGKYGDEGDKLMYRFEDNGKRKVALRYDQTVPLARVVAQYQNELPMPFKRYQISNVWRAENTQKGRFREFLQMDTDVVGSSSLLSDAEILAVATKSLDKLGFRNFKILINDRSVFMNLADSNSLSGKDLIIITRAIDKLKKIGEEKVLEELISNGFTQEKATNILQSVKNTKPPAYIENCSQILKNIGIDEEKIVFLPTLARGLDYYTGLIFEMEIEGYDAGSVAGGGRYDNLIGMFAGRQVPAVGFAFGFDRLMEALEQFDLFPKNLFSVKALVTISGDKNKSLEVYKKLRNENIPCELYLNEEDKLEKQLKYADRKNIPYSIIVDGSNIALKDMEKREQENLDIEEIIKKLK